MLTGRYSPRTGVRGVSLGQERLDLDETTLANVFQKAGYATGAFATLPLGQVPLPAGVGELRLRATEIPGQSAIDLRRVTLTLRPPE